MRYLILFITVGVFALPLAQSAEQSDAQVDHSKMDHAAMGHDMPTVTTGPWSYKDRKNPEPYKTGRWEMVPVPGFGHMFLSTQGLSRDLKCAALDNPGVMVDRATRKVCGMPETRAPQTLAAQVGAGAAPTTNMEGMDHGKPGVMDHSQMSDAKMHDHWMAPPEMAKRKNPVPADKASLARAKKIYETNCASCHGTTGKGDGPAGASLSPKPTDLTAMAGQHPDGDFSWKIANGRGSMPAWKGALTENQIWDLVNYIKGLAPRGSGENGGHGHTH